jgi:hypothetical protein
MGRRMNLFVCRTRRTKQLRICLTSSQVIARVSTKHPVSHPSSLTNLLTDCGLLHLSVLPIVQTAPAPSKLKDAYVPQSQHGHDLSERQFSQHENSAAPLKEQVRALAGVDTITQSQVLLPGRNESVSTSGNISSIFSPPPFGSQTSSFLSFAAQIPPELIVTSPSLTGKIRSEFSGTYRILPALVHSPDENKGIASPNEQGHTGVPRAPDGLLRSSENATVTDSSPSHHHSQSVAAIRAVSVNQLNSSGPNFAQRNTLNDSTSSLININTLWRKSGKPSMESLTRIGGERTVC